MELPWWVPVPDVPRLGPEELADRLRQEPRPVVVDVRTGREYRAGHIPHARWVPLQQLPHRVEEVVAAAQDGGDGGRVHPRVVAVCLTGHRSAAAARLLREHGVEAHALDRGMRSWWASDYPTMSGDIDGAAISGSVLPGGPVHVSDEPGGYRRALEALAGVPFTDGNRITVLRNGDEIFPAMLEAIRSAQHDIDLLTFVYWTGRPARLFADALSERSRAGVRVRILLDAYGAHAMKEDLLRQMRSAGAWVEFFRPLLRDPMRINHRTHRKVLVCDGRVGFTGGVGIAEEWEGDARDPSEWRDTHFRIEGPAVAGLRAAFAGNWIETGGALIQDDEVFPVLERRGDAGVQVLRSQPAATGRTDVEVVLRALVRVARRRLRLATAYFSPDRPFLRLLRDAARRGVHVEVLMPGPHIDKRLVTFAGAGTYASLLEVGVELLRFQPTMFHCKVLLVDDAVACMGSANLNSRSLEKDDELCVVTDHRPTVELLNRHFDEDRARSRALDLDDWRGRGAVRQALERLAGLVRPQL